MHIVLVEDNKILAKSIGKVLTHEGYGFTHFDNGKTGYIWLSQNSSAYDLVILDVLLPEMNGFEICTTLRKEESSVPILMLTSKNEVEDVVDGLNSGADDYLKKPFAFGELLARISSLSRRQGTVLNAMVTLTPEVTVDVLAQKVFNDGKEVHLTAKEFAILNYFLKNPNRVITQQELYDHVFDFAEIQLSNTIEVHIKNLRKKLRSSSDVPILTIRNAGYRLDYGN